MCKTAITCHHSVPCHAEWPASVHAMHLQSVPQGCALRVRHFALRGVEGPTQPCRHHQAGSHRGQEVVSCALAAFAVLPEREGGVCHVCRQYDPATAVSAAQILHTSTAGVMLARTHFVHMCCTVCIPLSHMDAHSFWGGECIECTVRNAYAVMPAQEHLRDDVIQSPPPAAGIRCRQLGQV